MLTLDSQVTDIPLIGDSYAQVLKKLNITTVKDLLHHYPHRYIDRSQTCLIEDLVVDEVMTIVGEVISFKNIYTRNRKNIQQAVVQDDSGSIQITWFNQKYLANTLKEGTQFAFSGKVKEYKGAITLSAPEFEQIKASNTVKATKPNTIHTGRLVPVYPETAGLSSKWLRSRIDYVLKNATIKEILPQQIVTEAQLLPFSEALKQIHQPEDEDVLNTAKQRLAFEEMLVLQLYGALKRQRWSELKTRNIVNVDYKKIQDFHSNLPFELTRSQQKASEEILSDIQKKKPMNRLLEGDVGSGKTVVALTAMYACYLNGQKSVLMAPTEILAQQHYKEVQKLLSATGIRVGLKTGSTKPGEGSNTDILIGTHALLYNLEQNKDLALIIIDEQHRFGVEQRAILEKLGSHPHRLTMSATPIPRTVALTLYGDLDVSIIDELPKNRKTVKTWVVPEKKRKSGYEWIRSLLQKGDQVFVVCPLIEKSTSIKLDNVKSVTEEFKYLQTIFPEYSVEILHGRLKAEEKNQIIQKFKDNTIQILVSTQVIEVGIDVPNASIMLIEAAERFGLAQLHQLRGRVGRGDKEGFCLLYTSNDSENSRLQAMTQYSSGFKLAEKDLVLRGPGEVFGMQQHGYDSLKLARITDSKLILKTKNLATKIISQDPYLTNYPHYRQLLRPYLSKEITFN